MRSLFWASAVLIVISSLASVHLWRELRDERQRTAAVPSQQSPAGNHGMVGAASLPPSPVTQGSVVLPASLSASNAAHSASPVPRSSDEISLRFRSAVLQQHELLKDPQYRKARIAEARVSIVRENPFLAEELELSEADANRVFDLMAEHLMAVTPQEQLEQVNQRNEQIASLLGPAKFTRWQQYEQNAPARIQANALNNMLSVAGQPLSPAQLKSLTKAMANEQFLGWQAEQVRQRILVVAEPIMSTSQLATLRAQVETQDGLRRASTRAREKALAAQSQQ